jgi:MFS family permease
MTTKTSVAPSAMVLPLALAQFVASYAATNMNVAISDIARDLSTTVIGVQTAITLFTLVMASLMVPGSKLTDIWGRKRCFLIGLVVYGAGGLIASLAPGIGVLVFGYSVLEGIGSALMIPPIYILVTVSFADLKTRAKYFGVVSGAGGLGAAAGPLIGGLVTSAVSWRASFGLQVLLVVWIAFLARRIVDPARTGPRPGFDLVGAVLAGAGMFFVVLGILRTGTYGWFVSRKDFGVGDVVLIHKGGISPIWVLVTIGVICAAWFYRHIVAVEQSGRDPLLSPRLFHNRASNLGLGTQIAQWLIIQGSFFATSVYLQQVRRYTAIETGLMLLPATVGILISSAAAERFARRRPQRQLVIAGFVLNFVGMLLLLVLVPLGSGVWNFVPGLFLAGFGNGVMLTSSVNIVQSSFPDRDQGDISGLSRSVSNLGSSLGTALIGSVLVAVAYPAGRPFALASLLLMAVALVGLVLAVLIPRQPVRG